MATYHCHMFPTGVAWGHMATKWPLGVHWSHGATDYSVETAKLNQENWQVMTDETHKYIKQMKNKTIAIKTGIELESVGEVYGLFQSPHRDFTLTLSMMEEYTLVESGSVWD